MSSTLKKILEWIKSIVLKLLRRTRPPRVDPKLEKYLGNQIQARKALRLVDTRHGGPNMPKYQPCDICNRGAKRVSKTSTGAKYHCTKCNNSMYVQAR